MHGNWAEWTEWGVCDMPCNTGLQIRTRECDNPVPEFGGDECMGEMREHRECNKHACASKCFSWFRV